MVGVRGFVGEWSVAERGGRWFRINKIFTGNPDARALRHKPGTIVHHTDYSIYGIGLGFRF